MRRTVLSVRLAISAVLVAVPSSIGTAPAASAQIAPHVMTGITPTSVEGPTVTATDPFAGRQWGLQQVRAPQAWATSTGVGQTVAVVDTGVDLTHPDLQGKLVPGATFTGCGGPSQPCGNGDWRGTDNVGQPADVHGTHVSGIAAAATDNGIGIAGVAPDARIMPIKVLEDGSGSFEEVGAGIRWAADHGATVINLSLGALPGAQALTLVGEATETKDAIAYARGKGVVVVASAGNETAPLCDTPAWEAGAVCVAATDSQESRAAYSNFAFNPDMKGVAAPGGAAVLSCDEDVWSTVPQGTGSSACGQRDYDAFAGTSMAAPHVSGVAALLAAQGRSADSTERALLQTARNPATGARGSFDPVFGHGIVDAQAAVSSPL